MTNPETTDDSHKSCPVIGRIALENKLISASQLTTALEELSSRQSAGAETTLQDILLELGMIDPATMEKLIATTIRKLDRIFGTLAVANGFVTRKHIDKALQIQADAFKDGRLLLICDLLSDAGLINETQKTALLDKLDATYTTISPALSRPEPSPADSFKTVQKKDEVFCRVAVNAGMITRELADKAMAKQSDVFSRTYAIIRVKDILLNWKAIHQDAINTVYDLLKKAPPTQVPAETGDQHLAPELIVSEDGMKAELIIYSPPADPVTPETIKSLLHAHKIIYGIKREEEILKPLSQPQPHPIRVTVAVGSPPTPSRDAEVSLFFPKEYLNPGKITPDGTIDFRDRGDVPFVKKDTLIAKKTPPISGSPGKNIFGDPIPVPEPNDTGFISGPGTRISADGLEIHADIDGQPNMTVQGELSVFTEITIPGDVDFTTGNIVFNGRIIVRGTVKEGFSVTGGSLTAAEVIGGTISVTGNVEVSGGIIDATIKAGGSVLGMYVANSTISSFGDVIIRKEIFDSHVMTSGACSGETTTIISSTISAKKGIIASRIGSEVSTACILKAGIDEHSEERVAEIKKHIHIKKEHLLSQQKHMEACEEKLKALQATIAEPVKTQEKFKETRKQIETKINELRALETRSQGDDDKLFRLESALTEVVSWINNAEDEMRDNFRSQAGITDTILKFRNHCEAAIHAITDLNQQITDIRNWSKTIPPNPSVKATKQIFAGTSFSGPNLSMVVSDTLKNSTIKEVVRIENGSRIVDLKISTN